MEFEAVTLKGYKMDRSQASALSYLLQRITNRSDVARDYWNARDNVHATFDEHPFGHEVKLAREGGLNRTAFLVEQPGQTNSSVTAMLLMLQHELTAVHVDEMMFRLRITRVQIARDWNDQSRFVHDLYFELVSWNGTFISAGCTDCTGCGGTGGRHLEAIFNLVGSLLNIPVEEVVIPVGRREEIDKLFSDTYHRHYKERNAA